MPCAKTTRSISLILIYFLQPFSVAAGGIGNCPDTKNAVPYSKYLYKGGIMNSLWSMMMALLFLVPLHGIASSETAPIKISSWTLVSDSSEQMDAIAKKFEIVSRHGNQFEIYVLTPAIAEFKALAPTALLTSKDTDGDVQRSVLNNLGVADGYRDFDAVNAALIALAGKYPNTVKLETIGESTKGRKQYGLKISDNVTADEVEPELIITAATHGDEIITTEVLLRFIEEMLLGYGQDQRLTALVDNHELYFVPVVNPDGFSARSRYSDGIDPNRDYPWPDHEDKISVKPIANMINFFKQKNFAGSIDFHAYGKLVMYPWAYTKDAPPHSDELIFDNLGRDMAAANSYTHGQISQVIYVAQGSSADYYYWKFNTLAYGIEIADSKAPNVSQIPLVLNQVREMTYKFIEHF
jgi:hypothetical protein